MTALKSSLYISASIWYKRFSNSSCVVTPVPMRKGCINVIKTEVTLQKVSWIAVPAEKSSACALYWTLVQPAFFSKLLSLDVMPSTTVVTKWKKRDDVCSDSDEQWLGECAEKTTSRGERERRAVWIPPSRRKVAEFRAR